VSKHVPKVSVPLTRDVWLKTVPEQKPLLEMHPQNPELVGQHLFEIWLPLQVESLPQQPQQFELVEEQLASQSSWTEGTAYCPCTVRRVTPKSMATYMNFIVK